MTTNPKRPALGLALALACAASPALAQEQPWGTDLMALDRGRLRGEIASRYDAALAQTRDPAIVAADDARHIWASEAKAQCGIAIGYLRSGHKDPISIGKCADAAERMSRQPVAAVQASADAPEICRQPIAGMAFFDWDSAVPGADVSQTVSFIANNMRPCGWSGLDIVGHADRSGSDSYNDGLSARRAEAIAGLLASAGVSAESVSVSARGEREPRVPTADGERNPQNRRVEITAR